MKPEGLFLLFVLAPLCGPGHELSSGMPKETETICGYTGKHYSLDARKVKLGLSTVMLPGDGAVGQAKTLRFRVTQKPLDLAVNDLERIFEISSTFTHKKSHRVYGRQSTLLQMAGTTKCVQLTAISCVL